MHCSMRPDIERGVYDDFKNLRFVNDPTARNYPCWTEIDDTNTIERISRGSSSAELVTAAKAADKRSIRLWNITDATFCADDFYCISDLEFAFVNTTACWNNTARDYYKSCYSFNTDQSWMLDTNSFPLHRGGDMHTQLPEYHSYAADWSYPYATADPAYVAKAVAGSAGAFASHADIEYYVNHGVPINIASDLLESSRWPISSMRRRARLQPRVSATRSCNRGSSRTRNRVAFCTTCGGRVR
jgi:hypothetical protein